MGLEVMIPKTTGKQYQYPGSPSWPKLYSKRSDWESLRPMDFQGSLPTTCMSQEVSKRLVNGL